MWIPILPQNICVIFTISTWFTHNSTWMGTLFTEYCKEAYNPSKKIYAIFTMSVLFRGIGPPNFFRSPIGIHLKFEVFSATFDLLITVAGPHRGSNHSAMLSCKCPWWVISLHTCLGPFKLRVQFWTFEVHYLLAAVRCPTTLKTWVHPMYQCFHAWDPLN